MESLKWFGKKYLPVIRQAESSECGLACLAMIANWYGLRTDLSTLRGRFNIGSKGMTLQQLMECATAINLSSRAIRLDLEELKSLNLPCILHWNMNHFVVLHSIKGHRLVIHDPDKGKISINLLETGKHFTGIALELMPVADFSCRDERKKIRLRQLTGKTPGLFSSMLCIMTFSLVLEAITLGGPLINQIVIDDVLVAADKNLLTVILIALLLLSLTQLLISLARQWASIALSVSFNMQWTANIFHHLIRLSLTWFDARSIGGINARFSAVNNIQQALTVQILEGILDVLLVITSLGMMLLYNTTMTFIVLLAALFYGVLRALWYPSLRQATEDTWDAETQESGHFLETLSGILSLRINGVIPHREAAWLNLNVERRNAQLRQSRLMMGFDIASTLTSSLVSTVILWKGANEVLNGTFTVGMFVAYLSYQTRFSSSASSLINSFFLWRMLDVYNERLADIVMTPQEGYANANNPTLPGIVPLREFTNSSPSAIMKTELPLVLEHLTFSHKGINNRIINDISMTLSPGEVVAITGKSGCGKSTLIQLILGIYAPDAGTIKTLGIPNSHPNYFQVRQHIGTVLQNDHLFRGCIADNIIFFHEDNNFERMLQCAQLSLIHDEIMKMPMGYQTLVGEGGGGLSGGQKQRILLARALYKQPAFLLLDEATSHLDIESEILISQTLRQSGIPVLLIAHRPETLASADRILIMDKGELR